MSRDDAHQVIVTGEQRAHPAIRLLARACIALAREQVEAQHKDSASEAVSQPAGPGDDFKLPALADKELRSTAKKPRSRKRPAADTQEDGRRG